MKGCGQYLARYAEPEAGLAREQLCASEKKGRWQYGLVIPVYKEDPAFYRCLTTTLLKQHAALLVLVVNQPDSLPGPDADNSQLWRNLMACTSPCQSGSHLELRAIPNTDSDVLLIDRFSPTRQIPKKQGVGLARKIGADIILSLIDSGHINHPWIYTSDADAQLPSNYFSALDGAINARGKAQPAAAIFPFKHLCDDSAIGRATRLYEQRMAQYVDGLNRAGSPYAFQTIGSTIAASAVHYAQVRGFPKRSGGEDFYLLNKLAKTGPIYQLPGPQINIAARQSDRVPFGTGPAISQLLLEKDLDTAQIFYHPQIFIELKTWLDAMPMSQTRPLEELPLSTAARQALQAIGATRAIEAARNISTSTQSFGKHLHTWFDAFKTLKFVHHLRDNGHPNLSRDDARLELR
ncbi:hypothetical protein A9Q90_02235 [Gammaproteobacteria bacterium 54_18_T64]|nr:hypothetical protein A9Q90_02235 [Gammaproteobacteria bacterium 54_18_T64]